MAKKLATELVPGDRVTLDDGRVVTLTKSCRGIRSGLWLIEWAENTGTHLWPQTACETVDVAKAVCRP